MTAKKHPDEIHMDRVRKLFEAACPLGSMVWLVTKRDGSLAGVFSDPWKAQRERDRYDLATLKTLTLNRSYWREADRKRRRRRS